MKTWRSGNRCGVLHSLKSWNAIVLDATSEYFYYKELGGIMRWSFIWNAQIIGKAFSQAKDPPPPYTSITQGCLHHIASKSGKQKHKITAISTLTRFRFNVVTRKRKQSDSYKNMHSDLGNKGENEEQLYSKMPVFSYERNNKCPWSTLVYAVQLPGTKSN